MKREREWAAMAPKIDYAAICEVLHRANARNCELGFRHRGCIGQSWGGLNGLPRTVCSALESASLEQLGRRRIQQLDDHEVGVSDFARTAGRFLEIGVTQSSAGTWASASRFLCCRVIVLRSFACDTRAS